MLLHLHSNCHLNCQTELEFVYGVIFCTCVALEFRSCAYTHWGQAYTYGCMLVYVGMS